jgi:hypothetical protein
MSVIDASRIIINSSRMMLQIVASLTDDSTGVTYNHNMFIVQATGSIPCAWHRDRHLKKRVCMQEMIVSLCLKQQRQGDQKGFNCTTKFGHICGRRYLRGGDCSRHFSFQKTSTKQECC